MALDEDPSPGGSSDQLSFSRDAEEREAGGHAGCNHEESSTTPPAPAQEQRTAGEDEDEEEDEELGEEEERREVEESSVEKGGVAEASSLSPSPLHLSVLGRREAQRERLNKILLDLLHRNPSKNGEREKGRALFSGLVYINTYER